MSKMNVATFLMSGLSHKVPNELGESERSLIISQLVDSWEDRKYLHPIPKYEIKRSANHFSAEYHWGLRKS